MIAKPDPAAQSREPGASKVPASSVYATKKVATWARAWNKTDLTYAGFMLFLHGLCLLAPLTFSWANAALFLGTYFVTGCLGITLSFHRQLSHKSFATPKWLEYALAYCGVLAVQGDPIEWASSHRYHHLHTGAARRGGRGSRARARAPRRARPPARLAGGRRADAPRALPAPRCARSDTPLDPHSPYEGFWWSHMGWLLDNQARACALLARPRRPAPAAPRQRPRTPPNPTPYNPTT